MSKKKAAKPRTAKTAKSPSEEEMLRFARQFSDQYTIQSEIPRSLCELEDGVSKDFFAALCRVAQKPKLDLYEFNFLVSVMADWLRNRPHYYKLFPELRDFTADVLEGKKKRPVRKGPTPDAKLERDYRLCRTVEAVKQKFNLPAYTRNELSRKITAAKIVSKSTDTSLATTEAVYKQYRRKKGGINPWPIERAIEAVYLTLGRHSKD